LTFLSSSKLIIGGGGLFLQNNIKTYYCCCCCVFFYKLFSKKVFISRVDIANDALRSLQNKWLFEKIVRLADFISVRDSDSYQEVIRYLPQLKDKIKIEDDYVIDYFKRQRFDRTKVEKQVGIALMQIDNFDYTKIANYLRDYVDKNYTIIFYIFFKNEGDLLITKKLISENSLKNYHIEEFKIEAPSLFEYVIESLSKNEIFISMRLHPLIISHMIGVDCKAIAHNLKIKNFAECNNIEEIK
jgi:polysaccharide pyruvyl transferase WcaK-like protein